MSNYQPDVLEKALWDILQPLINRASAPADAEALRFTHQSAGEWSDRYATLQVVSRQPQGQDEQLGFDDVTGEYFYKGQRNGQVSVTFHGDQASWRAENLVSSLSTETAKDLCQDQRVALFSPKLLNNVPIRDKERWLQGAAVVIGYRVAYKFSDTVGIIEIVDLTAFTNKDPIHKVINIQTP
ncbi:hypothetical protein [Pantoea phage Nafs113]|nr:hypothetical protein [Pantoea phage Nafs113]